MRRRLALAAAAGLVGLPLLPAASAQDSGCQVAGPQDALTAPVEGEVVRATTPGAPVVVRASLQASACARWLQVGPPGAAPYAITKAPASTEARSLDLTLSSVMTPRPNGAYVAVLTEDGPLAGAPVTRSFRLEVPPAAPAGVAAEADGRRVVVTWQPGGVEPDLVGYRVTDTGGAPTAVAPADACHDGTCALAFTYGDDVAGVRTYDVTAVRACPTCTPDGGELTTSAQPVSATVAAVPRPSGPAASAPSSAPAAGTARPLTPAQLQALKVPSTTSRLAAPAPQVALPDGTFSPTLGYRAAPLQASEDEPGGPGVLRRLGDVAAAPELARTVAGALLLLLAGAHLRRWSRSGPTG